MDYKLAKELKDAGFPQHSVDGIHLKECLHEPALCFPTLEELIEACGDEFDWLVHYPERTGLGKENFVKKSAYWLCIGNRNPYEGATPTEAVTRLWLALSKK